LPQDNLLTVAKYIYQYKDWTNFTWEDTIINAIFGEVRHLQGKIFGQMNALGFSTKEEATLTTLTLDVVKSSAIEGEQLNYEQVRSSIARRLGLNVAGLIPADRYIEGVVEMMLDATQNYLKPLTEKRLFGWHSALFPTGYSGIYKIEAGCYRTGEMQIVSGPMGKEKIHYEAVAPPLVKTEMDKFLHWFNDTVEMDLVLKAAIAHFWLLTRAENSPERFYSMSSQILVERKRYYEVLQKVQRSSGDITEWLYWFLRCLKNALLETENSMQKIVHKAAFWKIHEHTALNERQRLVLNKLLDGFDGKLKSSKWARIVKCSPDTALRDIKDLIEKGILQQEPAGGRSTYYELSAF
jgi:Fic family protein